MRDSVYTIGNLIDKTKISIISSVDESGFPNTKAMLAVRKREDIKCFYFSTNTSSMRVKQFRENNKAVLSTRCNRPRLLRAEIHSYVGQILQQF